MPPTALMESIDAVRRRARVLSVTYGVGIAVGAALALIVAVVALDYLLNLYALPRVMLIAGSLAAFAWCAFRYVATPATADVSRSDVAGRLERAFPQFEDRLRSTINFLERDVPGSPALQQRTIEQATRLAGEVDLSKAVVARPAITSAAAAATALLVLLTLTLSLVDRGTLAIIAARLLTPFSAPAWPKRVLIELTSTPAARVPVGDKINVSVSIVRGNTASLKPVLFYQTDAGPVQKVFMDRGNGDQFQTSLDARLDPGQTGGTLRVWIEAGDDRRELSPVTIVPRLAIRSIVAAISPPAYAAGRPVQTQDLATGPAVAAEGSTVAMTIHFNKPLNIAEPVLESADKTPSTRPAAALTWVRPDPSTAVARFAATAPRRFHVRATDADGFMNTALEEYELIVRPDTPPSITLETPAQSEERTATAFVPLQAVTEDDCGIADMYLSVQRLKPSPKTWTLPLLTQAKPEKGVGWQPIDAAPERVRNRLNYQWELKPLELSPGDVIEFQVMARDNFLLDGRMHDPVGTSKLTITIISQDELNARVTDELRSVNTQTGLLRLTQNRTKQETQQLDDDTKAKPKLDTGDQAVAQRLTQQQSSAAASAKQLGDRVQKAVQRLEENRSTADDLKNVAADVRDTLTQTGEGVMKDAAQKLADADQKDAPAPDRSADLKQAEEDQQKALNQLDRAAARLETIGSLQATIAQLNAILAEQRDLRKANEEIAKTNLGKKPEQMSEADKQKLDATADRQDKLADKTQKALDNIAKQAEQMKKSDPSSADAMDAAAKQAEQSKVTSNQKRAAQQTSQNQQANAQQTQQQVELGLEQALGELKEAQKRELARLQQQLSQLQEQVALLIRRQSGHNIDALLLQGPDKLKSAGAKLLATLTEQAKRVSADLKAAEMPLLTSGQELTGRNARDIAAGTDAQPQAARVGELLGKAAAQMERAVVSLRESKVIDAYDPHQVEALAALVEAKTQLDAQKKEADEKQQQQQKDAIRARYVKLRDRQKAVNADTVTVEKSRDAAGNFPRLQIPTMNRLPIDQAAIADDTGKIEADLQTLGSIVYVWANRDIKSAMDGAATELKALHTSVATQAEQDRVVEELDAMIKNLEEAKADPKFENGGGGGGGGSGGKQPPKMPTEAELKLLKALQTAVNTSTIKIAAAPKPDAPRLASLGGRQGELRNLLDGLLKKATEGKTGLGAEPDNKDQLPEEATSDDLDQKDLEDTLLGGDAGKQQDKVDQGFALVGTRMARSRQRLALNNDGGRVTQEIQKRILNDLDQLIDLAHKNAQQQQASSSPSKGQGTPKPGDPQQANNTGKNQPGQQPAKSNEGAVNNNSAGAGTQAHDLKELTEKASEWGSVTPRVRQAVIDSRGESIVEQYRKLIEDYYGALSAQSGKKR